MHIKFLVTLLFVTFLSYLNGSAALPSADVTPPTLPIGQFDITNDTLILFQKYSSVYALREEKYQLMRRLDNAVAQDKGIQRQLSVSLIVDPDNLTLRRAMEASLRRTEHYLIKFEEYRVVETQMDAFSVYLFDTEMGIDEAVSILVERIGGQTTVTAFLRDQLRYVMSQLDEWKDIHEEAIVILNEAIRA